MEAYESYQELFDDKMDAFFEKQGTTEQDFVEVCQKALNKPFSDDAHFVNNVLAATSYEAFVGMIVATYNRRETEAGSKENDSKNDESKSESKDTDAKADSKSGHK